MGARPSASTGHGDLLEVPVWCRHDGTEIDDHDEVACGRPRCRAIKDRDGFAVEIRGADGCGVVCMLWAGSDWYAALDAAYQIEAALDQAYWDNGK